jgi:hypothetical protein
MNLSPRSGEHQQADAPPRSAKPPRACFPNRSGERQQADGFIRSALRLQAVQHPPLAQ